MPKAGARVGSGSVWGMDGQPNGSSECTDGYWVWPEGPTPYVANHAVRLPDEFVGHVLRAKRPDLLRFPPNGEPDSSWWKVQVPRPYLRSDR